MFKRKTVLIVGAGCSAEFNLPVGNRLKDQIADQLGYIGKTRDEGGIIVISSRGSDDLLTRSITLAGQAVGDMKWIQKANTLSDGIRHAPSIDNYLHLHRDDEATVTIGKLAIARQIIHAERDSYLSESGVSLGDIKQKNRGAYLWLQELVSHMQADVPRSDMGQIFSNLTIVTFNYDRVIEHYLYHAIKQLALLSDDQAKAVMSKLTIIHPYGKIGRLPWQPDDGTEALPYGGGRHELHPNALRAAGARLRTFTETVEEPEIINPMHGAIATSDQIAFLGFSYLPQNLRLMTPVERSNIRVAYGTKFEESEANVRIAGRGVNDMLRSVHWRSEMNIAWLDMKAGQFMHDYGRELTG